MIRSLRGVDRYPPPSACLPPITASSVTRASVRERKILASRHAGGRRLAPRTRGCSPSRGEDDLTSSAVYWRRHTERSRGGLLHTAPRSHPPGGSTNVYSQTVHPGGRPPRPSHRPRAGSVRRVGVGTAGAAAILFCWASASAQRSSAGRAPRWSSIASHPFHRRRRPTFFSRRSAAPIAIDDGRTCRVRRDRVEVTPTPRATATRHRPARGSTAHSSTVHRAPRHAGRRRHRRSDRRVPRHRDVVPSTTSEIASTPTRRSRTKSTATAQATRRVSRSPGRARGGGARSPAAGRLKQCADPGRARWR
jgi:hypothetical protein